MLTADELRQMDSVEESVRFGIQEVKSLINQLPALQEAKEYNINVGKCYLIELENYIINPPETFTLHINWNNNIIPKDKYMKVEIVGIMGKMVKVNGVGYDFVNKLDLNTMWEGWLPRKAITIIKEL